MNIPEFKELFLQKNLILQPRTPYLVKVSNITEGFDVIKNMLYQISDKKTLLLLSGGKTPKGLYREISEEEALAVGAVGLIDERYGEKMHASSNEQMIAQSGLLGYLRYKDIPFYPILEKEQFSIEDTALHYDQTLRFLLNGFTKSIGMLGIGEDGHTAGIPAVRQELNRVKDHLLVDFFTNFPGEDKNRITMTLLGLSMLDILIVLVFGNSKKEALEKMFSNGSENEIPSRFFKRPSISEKTLIITDQKV